MWTFSLSWFLGGIAVIIAGTLIVVFHRWIGDNIVFGVSSYGKVKLFGIAAIALGFLFMTNLHTTLLRLLLHLIMPSHF